MSKYIKLSLLLVLLLIVDQVSKYWARNFLDETIVIIDGFFQLNYVENYGASFNILTGSLGIIIIITFIAIGLLLYMMSYYRNDKVEMILLVFIMAGTLGNLIDRLVFGFVTDFLDFYLIFYDFPVFNFADSFLVGATFLLFIKIFYDEKRINNG